MGIRGEGGLDSGEVFCWGGGGGVGGPRRRVDEVDGAAIRPGRAVTICLERFSLGVIAGLHLGDILCLYGDCAVGLYTVQRQ